MNPRPNLREAMRNANIEALEDDPVEEAGRQAVAAALAPPPPRRFEPTEAEERQRLLDAALMDASNVMERQRDRLGRRVTSRHDAATMRQIYELLRGMAGADGGADNDASFQ